MQFCEQSRIPFFIIATLRGPGPGTGKKSLNAMRVWHLVSAVIGTHLAKK